MPRTPPGAAPGPGVGLQHARRRRRAARLLGARCSDAQRAGNDLHVNSWSKCVPRGGSASSWRPTPPCQHHGYAIGSATPAHFTDSSGLARPPRAGTSAAAASPLEGPDPRRRERRLRTNQAGGVLRCRPDGDARAQNGTLLVQKRTRGAATAHDSMNPTRCPHNGTLTHWRCTPAGPLRGDRPPGRRRAHCRHIPDQELAPWRSSSGSCQVCQRGRSGASMRPS